MSRDDNEFRVRPGRSRDSGAASGRRSQKLAAQVQRAANKAGHAGSRRAGLKRGSGSGKAARGRRTVAAMRRTPGQRRVTVMARIARHKGAHYRAAPLAKHIKYLERDGVSRDGRDASMFDAQTDRADRDAFAGRCEDDRHHFRFIVSPEDAGDMEDLRSFTR